MQCNEMQCHPPPPIGKKNPEKTQYLQSLYFILIRDYHQRPVCENCCELFGTRGKCRRNKPLCQKNLFTKPGQGYKLAHSTFLLTRRWVQTRFPEIIWCGFNQICQNIMKWINSGFHLYIDRWIHSVVDINYRKIIPQICRTEWNQNKQY